MHLLCAVGAPCVLFLSLSTVSAQVPNPGMYMSMRPPVALTPMEVTALLSKHEVGGFEIRYWYDPIPEPLAYAALYEVTQPNGGPLAVPYMMTPDQQDYRLDELDTLFRRPLYFSPDVFRDSSTLDGSMVDGYVFAYGDVKINKRTTVTGTVYYANGDVRGRGDYVAGGAVPTSLSTPLDLVASYSDVLPLFAEAAKAPAKRVTRTDKVKLSALPGQTCYTREGWRRGNHLGDGEDPDR
ncbi:MAG: hypothetical protein AUJ96_18855 [Armatimonadetes bacterium CG2_30_66_41]|nr:MAG: hypothetical protein AUJ96_18855 [Armatimonadetes bacterium CG2_30_66_41]PJB76238.1 MAG: hypothetical protein CO096_00590 [Armatimonadetes bacterium CG_4_9_14_3_um_filter_66_14]